MASRKARINPSEFAVAKERSRLSAFALGLALVAATFAVHFPAIHAGYIWDDAMFLYDSPLVTAPDGLYKAWFTTQGSDYWPLMSTMFWIEWRICGNNPTPYHVTNIALHAAAVVLLWQLLRRLKVGGAGAYLAGVLFAVHPVTVESVAWISERKNVLSMAIFLLAVLAYLRFEDRNSRRWYVLALLAAAAALLAKVSTVMLPIVLLLCIWWRHSRLTRNNLLHTAPFFAMSLVLGLVEMWFVRNQALQGELGRPEGLASRIAATGWIVWFYLYKIIWPTNLAIVYPRWDIDGSSFLSYVPLALLVASFFVLWKFRRSWGRGPLAAMGYFVIMLLPVAGLLNMQFNRYSLVADHLQYPAMPAVMGLLGVGMATGWSRLHRKGYSSLSRIAVVVIGAIVLTLGILTWRQARVYRDEVTLWSHTISINDRAWAAYNNRGHAYADTQQQLAVQDFDKAISLKPNYAEAYNNRGLVHSAMGQPNQAIQDFNTAIALKPNFATAYNNRGCTYKQLGQTDAAIRDLSKAVELKPAYAEAYCNRGSTYSDMGRRDQAIQDYTKAIELKPTYAKAFYNRGNTFSHAGQHELAIQDYTKAIEADPGNAESYNNRGNVFSEMGHLELAILDYTRAIELEPSFIAAYDNRGNAYAALDQAEPAARDYTTVIELDPADANVYIKRAVAFFLLGQYDKSWADVKTCQQLGGTPQPDFIKSLSDASGRTE